MATEYSILKFKNMTELSHGVVDFALTNADAFIKHGSTHVYTPMSLISSTCEYSLDLSKVLLLTSNRWTRLVRLYLTHEQLNLFVTRIKRVLRMGRKLHAVSLRFSDLQPEDTDDLIQHPWGSCLTSLVYCLKLNNLILQSRTTRIGYTSFIDIALAHVILRDIIIPITGTSLESTSFHWQIASPQISDIYSMSYIYTQPKWYNVIIRKKLTGTEPKIWRELRRNFKFAISGKAKFGYSKRLSKSLDKVNKSVPLSSLNLECL